VQVRMSVESRRHLEDLARRERRTLSAQAGLFLERCLEIEMGKEQAA